MLRAYSDVEVIGEIKRAPRKDNSESGLGKLRAYYGPAFHGENDVSVYVFFIVSFSHFLQLSLVLIIFLFSFHSL
jgi:hypothetical protein